MMRSDALPAMAMVFCDVGFSCTSRHNDDAARDFASVAPEPRRITSCSVISCWLFSLSKPSEARACAACSCARWLPVASSCTSGFVEPAVANATLLLGWPCDITQIAPAASALTGSDPSCVERHCETRYETAPISAELVWFLKLEREISVIESAAIACTSIGLVIASSSTNGLIAPMRAMASWFSRLYLRKQPQVEQERTEGGAAR